MATRSLGQLTLDLIAKTVGFERGMDKSSRKAKKTAKDISDAFKGAMQTVLAFAGAAGIGALIKSQIDAADATGELAQQLGVTTEELSTLTFATEMSGASQDDLRLALRRLSRGVDEGIKGAGTYGKALADLGIEVKDNEGKAKSATDVLYDLAELFESMPDGAEKTAIAYKVLGDNGQRLIPLLNEGAEGMDRLREHARELGLEIGEDAAAAAALFNDRLDELRQGATGLGREIATDAVPKFNSIVTAMQEAHRESGLLMATWVGLGGVASEFFATRDLDEQIREVEEKLQAARDRARGQSAGSSANFGLIGPQTEDELLRIETELANLEVQRERAHEAERKRAEEVLAQNRERAEQEAAAAEVLREKLRLADEARQAEADEEKRKEQIKSITASLKEQTDTLGMTTEQLVRYRLESLGASEAQIELAVAQQRNIDQFKEQEKTAQQSAKLVEEFWTQAARNMQNAMAGFFYDMDGGIKDMLVNFLDAMRQMLSQALAFQTLSAIPGLGGLLNPVATPAGGNALGGAAMPGQLRRVNENGPELLSVGGSDYLMMGNQQGTVTPNSKLGGVSVTVNQDNRGAMSPAQIMEFGERLRGQILNDVARMMRGDMPA